MTRAIVFDLDGTLIDSCGICVAILDGMLADRGVSDRIDPHIARPLMSFGGEKMVAALLGGHCADPADELAEFRARYSALATPRSSLFGGVEEGIAVLRELGFVLAICSNKPQHLCDKVLADTGLAGHFAAVVGAGPALRPKPAPDLLDKTLAELGIPAGKCVYVGDSELDRAVAVQAGMPFHFLTHGYAEAGWTPEDGVIHDHFDQLVAELRRAARCEIPV